MNYWKRILIEWNPCRIVRILAGLPMMIYGISISQLPVILFGAAWLAAGIFSLQCCGGAACTMPRQRTLKNEWEAPEFSEIK
jgi:hypothetical protein